MKMKLFEAARRAADRGRQRAAWQEKWTSDPWLLELLPHATINGRTPEQQAERDWYETIINSAARAAYEAAIEAAK